MAMIIDRIRAWVRPGPTIRTANRPAVVSNTGDAVVTGGGYANTGYDPGPGGVVVGRDNHGSITTGRYPRHAVAGALREVLAGVDAIETGRPPLTHADVVDVLREVAAVRGIEL